MTDSRSPLVPAWHASTSLALQAHAAWDEAWPAIEQNIKNQGLEIICQQGCHGCCFDPKECTACEGRLIAEYLRDECSPERQEHFRSRVESAASNLQKMRQLGMADRSDECARSGGLECPFLERGICAIYPVRPLSCRSMIVAVEEPDKFDTQRCRECPAAAICLEAQVKKNELLASIEVKETSDDPGDTLVDVLSDLWQGNEVLSPSDKITHENWKLRFESRGTWFDHNWRDDGFDWQSLHTPVVLPEEDEYPPDLIVLDVPATTHEVYGELVKTNALGELRVLYKLLPGGRFDWEKREFQSKESEDSHIVWMGDSIQERLMMWEAAKRSTGRVLCGGLGMGIFPQFALQFPNVASVHVVEMDPAIVSLIEKEWAKKAWPRREHCSITIRGIEDYLMQTNEKYDTVYIDTWDALTDDYLPHINYLRDLAQSLLNPGGEVLLWGYDLLVRLALNQAKHVLSRRDYFLNADQKQLATLEKTHPLFHKMLRWFLSNPSCSRNEFYDQTYRLATTWNKDLGRLSLDRLRVS